MRVVRRRSAGETPGHVGGVGEGLEGLERVESANLTVAVELQG
jgi:hypothetical protein